MLPVDNIMITILNYDDMICDCQTIMEACFLLDIPASVMGKWVSDYLIKNLRLGGCHAIYS